MFNSKDFSKHASQNIKITIITILFIAISLSIVHFILISPMISFLFNIEFIGVPSFIFSFIFTVIFYERIRKHIKRVLFKE